MANPDGSGRGAREVSGVYPASMRPCVSAEFVAALAAYALQMDSGELALACVHYAHSSDPHRVPAASAVFLRWMAHHLESAADALDEAPESLPEVAGTTGEAVEMLAALLDEWRRSTQPARITVPRAADGE
jgi:hypothetical protein